MTNVTICGNLTAAPELRRFWSKVAVAGEDECWPWTAGRISTGYGAFRPTTNRIVLAHRYAYSLAKGEIPKGLVIDHLCRVRSCVNPRHLEAVTNEENLRRGSGYALQNGMRNHCVNGHEYTESNTYVDPQGGVRCRECARERDRQPHRNSTMRRDRYKKEN